MILTNEENSPYEELRFDYTHRSQPSLLLDAIHKIHILCQTIPGGVAVFFPSYKMLQTFTHALHTSNTFTTINACKRIFVESRENPNVFDDYASHIRSCKEKEEDNPNQSESNEPSTSESNQTSNDLSMRGGLLLAVIGGRLSEGINFSDDLGRCVAIVGMPYANRHDVVLKERMSFAEKQVHGSGEELYTNLCMKAINQTIGRAFRHQNDWAAIALLDCRYSQQSIRTQITPWINSQCRVYKKHQEMKNALEHFVRTMQCNTNQVGE